MAFRLEPDQRARSRTVATRDLPAGSLVVSCHAITTVLIAEQKGKRCDTCHTKAAQLQRCSGCASYFYCSQSCQTLQWNTHHRKICKCVAARRFNNYTSSMPFQALAAHEKMDALLLSHLVAQLNGAEDSNPSIMDLLPGPAVTVPPIAYSSPSASELYSRFGNNNFVVHSHLETFAHGIFPLASRLFNHSCLPNAAAKYILAPSKPPVMEVVALRDIAAGEEICLPYLDPALIQTRTQIFQLSYQFECRCDSCIFFEKVGPIPSPAPADREQLVQKLMGLESCELNPDSFPQELLPVFHESFIAYLAETFRNASHDGAYQIARTTGAALLNLYRLIYPPNYPQIGMHLLELAKTCWNSFLSENNKDAEKEAESYLTDAKMILGILGTEGDPDGPLTEIGTLETLLRGE
ncbi:hypothetical protein FB45DRAFT_987729, partial [Roridomyces roridus]